MQQAQSTGGGRNLNLRIKKSERFSGVEFVAVWTAMTVLDKDYSSEDGLKSDSGLKSDKGLKSDEGQIRG